MSTPGAPPILGVTPEPPGRRCHPGPRWVEGRAGQEPAPGGRAEPGAAGRRRLRRRDARSMSPTSAPTTPRSPQAARAAGAEVVDRPAELSGDTASSESALLHALDQLAADGAEPEIVVFVQCTSPFIAPGDLDRAVGMVADGQADSVFAAVPTYEFLWRSGPDGQASGINHDAAYRPRRQEREPHFRETGAFYVMSVAGFRAARHRFFGRTGCRRGARAVRGGDRPRPRPDPGQRAGGRDRPAGSVWTSTWWSPTSTGCTPTTRPSWTRTATRPCGSAGPTAWAWSGCARPECRS